jgi:thioredoxin-dependent peroxiredoxin
MTTLKMGDKAPGFDLKDQNGRNVRLSDFNGKKLFLYFPPMPKTISTKYIL